MKNQASCYLSSESSNLKQHALHSYSMDSADRYVQRIYGFFFFPPSVFQTGKDRKLRVKMLIL